MQKLIKIVTVFALVVNIFLNQAHALVPTTDYVQIMLKTIGDIIDKPLQAAQAAVGAVSSNANYQLFAKEFILDKVVVGIVTRMINGVQTDMIKWINSGYKGKPLFIQNPEVFYQNIYKAEVARVTNSLLREVGGLRDLNRDVAREFLRLSTNEADRLTKSLTPDYGLGICNNLAIKSNRLSAVVNDGASTNGILNAAGENISRERAIIELNETFAEYQANCTGSIKTQNQAQQECLKDFGCSGFEGMLSVVMNLGRNTEAGRLSTVIAESGKSTESKTSNVKNELLQGNGFLSKRECTEYAPLSEGDAISGASPKCIKEKVTTPGQAAVSALDQVIKDPVQRAQLADEINEAVENIAATFANKIISDGLAYVTDGVNEVANNLDTELYNLQLGIDGRTQISYTPPATIDLDRIIQAPSSTSTASQAPTGTILTADSFKDPNYEIQNAEDKAEIVKPLMSTTKTAMTKNAKELTFIGKEIAKYKEVLAAYNEVAMCYQSKRNAQQALIDSGRHTIESLGSYYFTYPSVIPLDYRKRGSELDALIKGLELRITNNTISVDNINIMIDEVDKATNYKAVQYYSDKINTYIEQYLFVESEWEQKDVKNGVSGEGTENLGADYGLYAKLDEERSKLLDESNAYDENGLPNVNATGLSRCNSLRIEPPTIDLNPGS